jgi:hypothetical protein
MRNKRPTNQFLVTYRHFIGGDEKHHEKIAIRLTFAAEIRTLHLQNRS